MALDIKKLREEFNALDKTNTELLDKVSGENRGFSDEEKLASDKAISRMAEIKGLIEAAKRSAALAFSKEDLADTDPKGKAEFDKQVAKEERIALGGAETYEEFKERFNACASDKSFSGSIELFVHKTTDQSGAHIPKEVADPHVVRRNVNAIRQAATLFPNSDTFQTRDRVMTVVCPLWDDTANNGAAHSEASTTDTANDYNRSGTITLDGTVVNQSTSKWFSNTELASYNFDVLGKVVPSLQATIDRREEAVWVANLKSNASVGETITFGSFEYQELVDFEESLPSAYQRDAVILLSGSGFALLRAMRDDNGRPILEDSKNPSDLGRYSVHGIPVIKCESFDFVAPGATIGAIVSVSVLRILDITPERIDVYGPDKDKPDQKGYNMFRNSDFDFFGVGVRLLKCGSST